MTDKQPPQKRKLVRQKVGPVDKRRRPRGLTLAIRAAIDAMVYERRSRAEACQIAGIAERSLYLALEKPEVAQYWNRTIEMLRTGERARNLQRLLELRDQDVNMNAAVKATVVLIEHDPDSGAPLRPDMQPGIQIVVNEAPAHPFQGVTIEARSIPVPSTENVPPIPHAPLPPRPAIFRPRSDSNAEPLFRPRVAAWARPKLIDEEGER